MKKFKIPVNPGLIRSQHHVEYDPRKVSIMATSLAAITKPIEFFGYHAVQHIAYFIYNQASIPCCVAESGSRYVGVLSLKENNLFVKPSVKGLMGYIKTRIEKNTGQGAELENCPKAIKEYGVPLESEYPSNYNTDWINFINISTLSTEVEEKGTRQKIQGYAWTDNDLESYKVAIYSGEGNFVEGGVIGSNEGWQTGYVRPYIRGEKVWGHAIGFFGYDADYNYFINSWGTWGLTLYLKLVENEFGKYFVKVEKGKHDLEIKGVGALDKRYGQPDYAGDPGLFRGYTYIDLPDELAQITKMLKTIQVKSDNRIYAVVKDTNDVEWYAWITSDRMYNAGVRSGMWLGWDKIIPVDSLDGTKVIGTFNKEY